LAGNSTFLRSEATLAWLGQFDPGDQAAAAELLRAMSLVSRDAFAERLRSLIVRRLAAGEGPIGLYVERELRHRKGVPHRLFKESETKVRRAYGVGPAPVQPTRAYDADVGSEGIVAQLVSELCREQPTKFLNHPGPDEIRRRHMRRFMLVTDFIGSGKRARRYIEAAWRVRSVRSWWSARAHCGLGFEVITYAATDQGRRSIETHPARPAVHVVVACPTIDKNFGGENRKALYDICARYAPIGTGLPPRGFGSTGALIAFAHGVPNNTPLILHKRSAAWTPLFPARVTSNSRAAFAQDQNTLDTIRARLIALRQSRLAHAINLQGIKASAKGILLVLAAAARPPRQAEAIANRTGLTMIEVDAALARALAAGWVDGRHRLTNSGRAELAQARRLPVAAASLPSDAEEYYCPTQLRAPSVV
jgi:hypothetical protein